MFRAIGSFIRRRVQIDVGPTDIVLDVGSGDKPHWRANVLLENYPSASFAQQRSEGGAAVVDRWMVVGNVQDMPFRDKVFDYAICSHLLEHVEHPDQAISELQRVAKRGYIEVPFEGAQKLYDFPSHLWYVHSQDGKLVFTAKQSTVFDPYIECLMRTMVRSGVWARFENRYFDECIVTKYWEDQISYEIRGELTEQIKRQEVMARSEHGTGSEYSVFREKARALFFSVVRLAYRNKASRVKLDIASLLRCRKCSSEEFAPTSGGYVCCSCGALITVLC